jgi:hypothetical protein
MKSYQAGHSAEPGFAHRTARAARNGDQLLDRIEPDRLRGLALFPLNSERLALIDQSVPRASEVMSECLGSAEKTRRHCRWSSRASNGLQSDLWNRRSTKIIWR